VAGEVSHGASPYTARYVAPTPGLQPGPPPEVRSELGAHVHQWESFRVATPVLAVLMVTIHGHPATLRQSLHPSHLLGEGRLRGLRTVTSGLCGGPAG